MRKVRLVVLTQFLQQNQLQCSSADSNQEGIRMSDVHEDESGGSNFAYIHIQLTVPVLQHSSHED